MSDHKIIEDLRDAIIELDDAKAVQAADSLIASGIDPLMGIEKGLSIGMTTIGDKFNSGDCFLPELIRAGNTFNAAVKVLEPEIVKRGESKSHTGIVVLGTVTGDVHKIGKEILAMLLKTRGFVVHDLGEDVSLSDFVAKAEELSADIIAMSALLTTTMPAQKEVIDFLIEKGIRDNFLVMVGGGPVSQEWSDKIGADGYAETAEIAVKLAKNLIDNKA
ncbi:MAG: corrinoid protein [Deltaproteobacteria bacterium]|nr:corrinoid protein [Deltaproteobacteria bacterium]